MKSPLLVFLSLSTLLLSSCISAEIRPSCDKAEPGCVNGKLLHVPSPDWRDQVVYFLMIDRFNDGDPARNDQGYGLHRPSEEGAYSGGDLQGVIDRLDYIQELGATAVWTTPPFANQWWSDSQHYGGYHGYWPQDFSKVDAHYGDLETYQNLSHALHSRDMYLIMDIVVNHTGNYFEFTNEYDPNNPAKSYRSAGNNVPTAAPTMSPFDLNDVTIPEHREAAIYNWTPSLATFDFPDQELTYQLGGLDDINTRNPAVRAVFKNVFADWINKVGIDSYRIDTVKYVEPSFWTDFLHSENGVYAAAKKTGRDDFWVFGEVKESSAPLDDTGENKMQKYLSAPGAPQFDALINFPLQEEIVRVVAEGAPTSLMTYRLNKMQALFDDLTIIPNFVSNHDVPRFGSLANETSYRQALAMMFALPGVPVLYQGDEQNLTDSRQAMFAGGYLSPESQFKPASTMYQYVQSLIELRNSHAALRRGNLKVVHDNPVASGAFVFTRSYEGETLLFAFNTAAHKTLAARLDLQQQDGTLEPIYGTDTSYQLSSNEQLNLTLPAHAFQVFRLSKAVVKPEANQTGNAHIQISTTVPSTVIKRSQQISGTSSNIDGELLLIENGDLDTAQTVALNANGRWQTEIKVDDLGTHQNSVQLYAPRSNVVSDPIVFQTRMDQPAWCITKEDPIGDDKGPHGSYRLPASDGFTDQQDIHAVSACGGGDVLQLRLTMGSVTDGWSPVNGFDHVAFTTLFEFPGAQGGSKFEELNLKMPDGKTWSHASAVFGWGNYLMTYPGNKLGRSAGVDVNKEQKTITLTLRASDFGQANWNGVNILVTTWDRAGEGALRFLTPKGAEYDYAGDPDGAKVMDDAYLEIKF